MTKTIRAEAIISAKDATGTVFGAIAAKIAKLSATANSASSRAASAGMRANTAQQRSAGSGGPSAAARVGGAARGIGYAGANMVGLPGLGAAGAAYMGVKSYKSYAEAELAIKRIGITAEATDEEIAGMEQTLRAMALKNGQSFQDVASGLESIVSAGFDLDKAMKLMPAVTMTAQAAGAEIKDIANTGVSLQQAFNIKPERLQEAFDILNTAGKEGKFELKDLARYMASIGPAAKAAGFQGMEGLQKLASMLETIRQGTGTSDEAADSMINILQKMESEETSNKFKKFGVDLPAAMKKAREEGRNLVEAFTDLAKVATKGDLSKLNNLIADLQFNRGERALLTYGETFDRVMKATSKSLGSTAKDHERVMVTQQMKLNQLSESWNKFMSQLGSEMVDLGIGDALDAIVKKSQEAMDRRKLSLEDRGKLDDNENKKKQLAQLDSDIANAEADQKPYSPAEIRRRELAGLSTKKPSNLDALRLKRMELQSQIDLPDAVQNLPKVMQSIKKSVEGIDFLSADDLIPGSKGLKRSKAIPLPMSRPKDADYKMDDESAAASKNTLDTTPGPVTATLTGTAEVKGQADVNVHVTIDDGAVVKALERHDAAMAEIRGQLRAGNGPGSNGRSSPDAGAPKIGASGSW